MTAPAHLLTALTLKAYDYQEADRLLHVFSAEEGPRTVIVKGARKPASKLVGACDPLMLNQLEVFGGRQFDRLKRFETLNPFGHFRHDLSRLSMALVLVDWLRSLSSEGDVHARPAFEVAVTTLTALNAQASTNRPVADSLQQLIRGQIALLQEAGYLPEVFQTVDTAEPWEAARTLIFSLEWGGLVAQSADARQAGHTLIQLRPGTLEALQSLVTQVLAEDETPVTNPFDEHTLLRLEKFLRFYVEQRIRQPLKSHEFLHQCLSGLSSAEPGLGKNAQ